LSYLVSHQVTADENKKARESFTDDSRALVLKTTSVLC